MVLVESLLNGLVIGAIYAMFAASFTIIFGVMDIPNMAHAAMFTLGAYVFYQLAQLAGLPWVVALLGAIVAVAAVGVVVERGLLRLVYDRADSAYVFGTILLTLGVARIMERAIADLWGRQPYYLDLPAIQDPAVVVAGSKLTLLEAVVFAFGLLSFAFLYWLMNYTMVGTGLRAIVQDRELAYMKGIDVDRLFLYSFVLGSALAAVAGILNAAMFQLTPTMGESLLFKAFIVVILGGIGRVFSVGAAAFALGLYESYAVLYLSSYHIIASEFAVLILFFLVKAGLLSRQFEDATLVDLLRTAVGSTFAGGRS